MLARAATPVGSKTAGSLTAEIADMGARLLLEVLADLPAYPPVPQPEAGVTYAAKIDKAESRLDFTRPAVEVERQVRAFNPAPGAWFAMGGERIKMLVAAVETQQGPASTVLDERLLIACGSGSIRPALVQRAGKGAMPTGDMLRGFSVPPGTILE
jgi:methionyl-tRNA formyltransferase